MPPNMHPAAIAHVKVFAFMLPLKRQIQRGCKLSLVESLGEVNCQ
jgi:hypothetical protein